MTYSPTRYTFVPQPLRSIGASRVTIKPKLLLPPAAARLALDALRVIEGGRSPRDIEAIFEGQGLHRDAVTLSEPFRGQKPPVSEWDGTAKGLQMLSAACLDLASDDGAYRERLDDLVEIAIEHADELADRARRMAEHIRESYAAAAARAALDRHIRQLLDCHDDSHADVPRWRTTDSDQLRSQAEQPPRFARPTNPFPCGRTRASGGSSPTDNGT